MTKDIEKDFAINDILTKDEPKIAMNIRVRGDDYIYMGGDDKPRKAGCDKHKFEKWLTDCPVTIYKREDCAYGWVEMHFIIDDEREED